MHVELLHINAFRNLVPQEITLSPGVNILFGRNATGKTNVLEALSVVALGRSQRGANDAAMIPDGGGHYRLEGSIDFGSGRREQAVAYERSGRKKITVDSLPIRMSRLYEDVLIVSAGPEDSAILSGPPAGRRTLLDFHLSQQSDDYLSKLTKYSRALAQKNAALKISAEASAFDELMVSYGSALMMARQQLVTTLAPQAAAYYAAIADGSQLEIVYRPSVGDIGPGDTADTLAEKFVARMVSGWDRERAAQMALVGPHRDEVEFRIDSRPARTHGSQGEWRTAAVATKLAMYHWLRRQRNQNPILLLDEIFAELDSGRNDLLVEQFEDFGQLVLTTAGSPPGKLSSSASLFEVVAGRVNRSA